jgi:hypothetical protein
MPRSPAERRNETPSNRERHRHLLEDRGVRSWYAKRSLRSKLSADSDLRKLGLLLQRLKLGPSQVVEMAGSDPRRLEELLVQYASQLKKRGRRDAYIAKTFSGLKNWLDHNHSKFDDYPALRVVRGTTLTKERVPTPEEMRRILGALSPRGRVTMLMMAHTGVRPQVLGSYEAESGLRLGDLPELRLGRDVSFARIPFMVRVPAELSKTGKAYTTFGSAELADAIVAYLRVRMSAGPEGHRERLHAESPLVAVAPQAREHAFRETRGLGHFITTKALVGCN